MFPPNDLLLPPSAFHPAHSSDRKSLRIDNEPIRCVALFPPRFKRGDSGLMFFDSKLRSTRVACSIPMFTLILVQVIFGLAARAQEPGITNKLQGFDSYVEQVLKDWNTPGIGVGIVVGDKLVFAKGYGYRDYEKKLQFTPATLCQIASNSKLFTAGAAAMLVEGGKQYMRRFGATLPMSATFQHT